MITRVLIADHNAQFRAALRRLVERDGDLSVAGEAASVAEALGLAAHTAPDVILVDVDLPGLDGPEQVGALRGPDAGTGIVFLSLVDPSPSTEQGASYLLKSVPADEILAAIRRYSVPAAAPVSGP